MRKVGIAALFLCTVIAVSAGVSTSQQPAMLKMIENPAGAGARVPRLKALPGGRVLMSWVEPRGDGHVLKYAVFEDGHWQSTREVAHGDRWFVNWSDFPSVVAIDNSFWVAHWLVKQAGGRTYDYDVALSVSNDGGVTWSQPKPPHRDGQAAEHGFAAIFPTDGHAGIVWLDGREYVDAKDRGKHPHKSGNFQLRYTTVSRDGTLGEEQVVDNNTCTCCWPNVGLTSTGAIAAWRGHTDKEIRDNRVARLEHGTWTAPAPLGAEGWEIAGCPVNGPALAVRGNNVAAAWFTAEGDRPRVRVAFSHDGGSHFGKPIEVDDAAPLGRVGLIWKDDRSVLVSWMLAPSALNGAGSIALRRVGADGLLGNIHPVAEVSAGRDTGVPQMVEVASGTMLAWTAAAPAHGIKTAVLDSGGLESSIPVKQGALAQNTLPFSAYVCRQPH